MLRVLVAGGLNEMGSWTGFARTVGEQLAKAGAGVSLFSSSGFGAAVAEGWLKGPSVPGELRIHPDEKAAPSALAAHVVEPLPPNVAGDVASQALRECDLLLVAGNGRSLGPLAGQARAREIPVVPLPIPGATSEEIWEGSVGQFPRVQVSLETRQAFLGLRRKDPRSAQSATTFATFLHALAAAPQLPGGPNALLVSGPSHAEPGEDDLATVVRRALRTGAPGAALLTGPPGWLRSPGRAFVDAAKRADLVVVDLAEEAAALYALGLARGANRPALALLRRGQPSHLNVRGLDAAEWGTDRELAAVLERWIRPASPRREKAKGRRRGARDRRGRPRDARADKTARQPGDAPTDSGEGSKGA